MHMKKEKTGLARQVIIGQVISFMHETDYLISWISMSHYLEIVPRIKLLATNYLREIRFCNLKWLSLYQIYK